MGVGTWLTRDPQTLADSGPCGAAHDWPGRIWPTGGGECEPSRFEPPRPLLQSSTPRGTGTDARAGAERVSLMDAGSRSHRSVSYTHLRAHETRHDLVCRLL